ncbi:isoprenylcysteine carboxylmethyltransferase family protein [Mycobacterium sp. TNTM28]|uniref:Isoprenylcysteine carboxylmethyltransferase family protein n=1 Tax=[Mycobacterium] fortunisiensis TaxID=2600579 RepID=A0ABS6KHP7_9MYCO|nr:isoprenylcysteine carboxylmethyltransferase family protein [[Mycobacterium] fortunisiensis]MBU9763104.1 isoprenylcysteine carboxylmethyltransferase family protein [[Mycobacterium] fortunisiensis]
MKSILKMLLSGFLLMSALWLLLFVPAGTLNYWQAWLFFAVLLAASWVASIYLLRKSPAILERRMMASESRGVQKVLSVATYVFWIALVVVSALDHRFGWSTVPIPLCLVGFVLIVVGIGGVTQVFAQNSHAAITIRVEEDQPLISTGVYALVRHPMYTFNTFLYTGTPLALGSYWGLLFAIPAPLIFALRICDEEKLLREELTGYGSYMQKVPHRLVPGLW